MSFQLLFLFFVICFSNTNSRFINSVLLFISFMIFIYIYTNINKIIKVDLFWTIIYKNRWGRIMEIWKQPSSLLLQSVIDTIQNRHRSWKTPQWWIIMDHDRCFNNGSSQITKDRWILIFIKRATSSYFIVWFYKNCTNSFILLDWSYQDDI